MAVGLPVKANYAAGDILTATNMNDLSGTFNNVATSYGQAGGKNAVINGAMQIWQRGTSITGTTTSFSADRWQSYRGVAGSTFSRQVTNDTTNLPNIQYCLRVQRDSGNTSTTAIAICQNFETINSIPFAGKTVTLSFYARAGANFSQASSTLPVILYSGTGTDQNTLTGYSGQTAVITGNSVLTTTWQRFTYTGTVATSATELSIYVGNFVPVGTAGANDYYEITGVQLEAGSIATPFQTASGGSIQGELAMCQRYYYKTYNQSVTPGSATFNGSRYIGAGVQGTLTALQIIGTAILPPMRTSPTVTAWDPNGNINRCTRLAPGINEYANEVVVVDNLGENGVRLYSASGNSASSFILHLAASAEL